MSWISHEYFIYVTVNNILFICGIEVVPGLEFLHFIDRPSLLWYCKFNFAIQLWNAIQTTVFHSERIRLKLYTQICFNILFFSLTSIWHNNAETVLENRTTQGCTMCKACYKPPSVWPMTLNQHNIVIKYIWV